MPPKMLRYHSGEISRPALPLNICILHVFKASCILPSPCLFLCNSILCDTLSSPGLATATFSWRTSCPKPRLACCRIYSGRVQYTLAKTIWRLPRCIDPVRRRAFSPKHVSVSRPSSLFTSFKSSIHLSMFSQPSAKTLEVFCKVTGMAADCSMSAVEKSETRNLHTYTHIEHIHAC